MIIPTNKTVSYTHLAQGEKGLQQSQAVFLHIRNLRKLFEENKLADYGSVAAVCVSAAPRRCV